MIKTNRGASFSVLDILDTRLRFLVSVLIGAGVDFDVFRIPTAYRFFFDLWIEFIGLFLVEGSIGGSQGRGKAGKSLPFCITFSV